MTQVKTSRQATLERSGWRLSPTPASSVLTTIVFSNLVSVFFLPKLDKYRIRYENGYLLLYVCYISLGATNKKNARKCR